MLLDIIILVLLSKKNNENAKARGKSGGLAIFITIIFWYGFMIIGAILGILVALAMDMYSEEAIMAVILVFGIIGMVLGGVFANMFGKRGEIIPIDYYQQPYGQPMGYNPNMPPQGYQPMPGQPYQQPQPFNPNMPPQGYNPNVPPQQPNVPNQAYPPVANPPYQQPQDNSGFAPQNDNSGFAPQQPIDVQPAQPTDVQPTDIQQEQPIDAQPTDIQQEQPTEASPANGENSQL